MTGSDLLRALAAVAVADGFRWFSTRKHAAQLHVRASGVLDDSSGFADGALVSDIGPWISGSESD